VRDRDRYRAERATYTNCALGDDDWYLRVGQLDLDRLRDVGAAHNATLVFKGVPILYTPWIDFPLSSRRKTGFLTPVVGTSNNSGFEATLPFYWNFAPNYDYTIAPRLLARRGLQVNNEVRYLEPSFNGQLRRTCCPTIRKDGDTRWGCQHSHLLTQRLRGWVNYQACPTTPAPSTCQQDRGTSQPAARGQTELAATGGRAGAFPALNLAGPLAPVTDAASHSWYSARRSRTCAGSISVLRRVVDFDHPDKVARCGRCTTRRPCFRYAVRSGTWHPSLASTIRSTPTRRVRKATTPAPCRFSAWTAAWLSTAPPRSSGGAIVRRWSRGYTTSASRSSARTTCRCSTPRKPTSTWRRSSPRISSPAGIASTMPTRSPPR
jgi:hypothetical protein